MESDDGSVDYGPAGCLGLWVSNRKKLKKIEKLLKSCYQMGWGGVGSGRVHLAVLSGDSGIFFGLPATLSGKHVWSFV